MQKQRGRKAQIYPKPALNMYDRVKCLGFIIYACTSIVINILNKD